MANARERRREGDGHELHSLLLISALFGAAILYLPEITAWARERADQSIAARSFVACDAPTEHEQLHIVILKREGRIAADCMYLGSRGTYHRRSQASSQ